MTDLDMGAQPRINWPALNEEFKLALPGKIVGTSYANDVLYVHIGDGLDAEALRSQITTVIAAHDPKRMTAEQQQEAEFASRREIFVSAPLKPDDAEESGIRELAERVAWLEGEVKRLIGAKGDD